MRRPDLEEDELTPLVSDEWPKPKRKKDTKHWCKGKVGREHEYEIVPHKWRFPKTESPCRPNDMDGTWHWYNCNHMMKCKKCGKELMYGFNCPDTGLPR